MFPQKYPKAYDTAKICSVEIRDNVYILRMINHRNMLNIKSINVINEALEDIEHDYAIKKTKGLELTKALVTTGQNHVYSGGLDFEEEHINRSTIKNFLKHYNFVLARLLKFPIPTIAALNGFTYSVGIVFAMAHDFRVTSSDKSIIHMYEIDAGIELSSSIISLLKEKTRDFQTFRDLVLHGHVYNAEEALSTGLVDFTCSGDQVLDKSLELAHLYGDRVVNGSETYTKTRICYFTLIIEKLQKESLKRALGD